MYLSPPSQEEPKRRRDAGVLQVTERDTIVLSWISEQFCIAFDQLQQLLGRYAKATTKVPGKLSVSATRDTVNRWLQFGFIEEPRKIATGYPPFLWLSRRGLSQLGLADAYYRPQVSSVKHIYAVNAIRLYLESVHTQALWYPERALFRETTRRPVPDAELRLSGEKPVAVKIIASPFKLDVTRQDALETCKALATRYPTLWYFLHAEAVSSFHQLLSTCDQKIQQRVTVYGLDTPSSPIAINAQSTFAERGPFPTQTNESPTR